MLVQSCLTLCNPMDCSPPGSSVHGVFQARILEWVAISSSRGSSQPRDQTCGHIFEGNPVDEGTTRSDTDIPMHRLEKPADSTHSSKYGLSPREQLERQVKLHSFTQDEALLSCPNSSGTLQLESEMERSPEVPASTREEAFFH